MDQDRTSLLGSLSSVLWRERQLLELLLFKLVEEQLVLGSGDHRWLARATREVELVLDQVRVAELGREVEVSALAGQLGLPGEPNLRALIAEVEEPWTEIFTKHREGFLELTREITEVAAANRALVGRAQAATRQTLEWLGERAATGGGYTASGAAAPATARVASMVEWRG